MVDKTGQTIRQIGIRCTTKQEYFDVVVHDEAGHELIERHMLEQLREVAEYTRVVLINGPRQLVRRRCSNNCTPS